MKLKDKHCPGFFKLGRLYFGEVKYITKISYGMLDRLHDSVSMHTCQCLSGVCEGRTFISTVVAVILGAYVQCTDCRRPLLTKLALIYPPCCLQYSGIHHHGKFIHSPRQLGNPSFLNHQNHCGINNVNITPIPALTPPYCSFCLSWLGFHSSLNLIQQWHPY